VPLSADFFGHRDGLLASDITADRNLPESMKAKNPPNLAGPSSVGNTKREDKPTTRTV
jgi:hypothetical protein